MSTVSYIMLPFYISQQSMTPIMQWSLTFRYSRLGDFMIILRVSVEMASLEKQIKLSHFLK